MTDPSAGKANEPPTPTESGGADTEAAEALPCPGMIACTAKALEVVGDVLAVCSAPAEPTEPTSTAMPTATGARRTTAPIIGDGRDNGEGWRLLLIQLAAGE